MTKREADRLLRDLKDYKKALAQMVKLFGPKLTRRMLGIKSNEKW